MSLRCALPAAAITGPARRPVGPVSPPCFRRPDPPSQTSSSSHHGDRMQVSDVVLVVVGQVAADQVDPVVSRNGKDRDRRANGVGVVRAHRGGQPRAPQRAHGAAVHLHERVDVADRCQDVYDIRPWSPADLAQVLAPHAVRPITVEFPGIPSSDAPAQASLAASHGCGRDAGRCGSRPPAWSKSATHGIRGRGHCPSPTPAVNRSAQVKGISSKSTATVGPLSFIRGLSLETPLRTQVSSGNTRVSDGRFGGAETTTRTEVSSRSLRRRRAHAPAAPTFDKRPDRAGRGRTGQH